MKSSGKYRSFIDQNGEFTTFRYIVNFGALFYEE